jgi:hypothetical protein
VSTSVLSYYHYLIPYQFRYISMPFSPSFNLSQCHQRWHELNPWPWEVEASVQPLCYTTSGSDWMFLKKPQTLSISVNTRTFLVPRHFVNVTLCQLTQNCSLIGNVSPNKTRTRQLNLWSKIWLFLNLFKLYDNDFTSITSMNHSLL